MNNTVYAIPGMASSRFFKFCASVLQPATRRHQSSYRRSRSKLNIKPDASFLPTTTETHDHIVYNPPPSMPNVYHTPSVFLPKSDKRRQIQAVTTIVGEQSGSLYTSTATQRLPPPVRTPYEKRYHLGEAEMEEMRSLRRTDANKWTVSQLAKKFDCSGVLVRFVTDGIAREKQKQQRLVTAVVKSRWGPKRRIAREDRAIRKEKWYRDE